MLRCFAGQRTKTPIVRKTFTGIVVIVEETAACYPQTLEALLFQPPPKSSPLRGGLSSVGHNCERRRWQYL